MNELNRTGQAARLEKPPQAVTATPTKMIESEVKQEHMTTINDISDLIRILRDDPAWAEAVRSVLLSQELLRLPEEVAALTRAFREHAETTNRRLESLEAGQDELRQGQARLQTTVDGLQETVDGLQETVDGLQTTVDGVQTTVNGVRGDLGNLSGSFFQRRAASFAERVARRDFHLRQTSLVHHADQVGDSTLKQKLNDAAEDATRDFTEDDAELVERADAVIAGKAPDGTEVYLLVEMSVTVAKDDVDRAKDGAEVLQRAVGETTHALVIGDAITDEAATLAKDRAVTFAQFTPKRPPSQDRHTSQQK